MPFKALANFGAVPKFGGCDPGAIPYGDHT
jgi:hypothetical protein